MGVSGGAWGFLGDLWASLEGPREVHGRAWDVPGGSLGFLGAALGDPWGAYRSLGAPGAPSGVHGGSWNLSFVFLGRETALGKKKYYDVPCVVIIEEL